MEETFDQMSTPPDDLAVVSVTSPISKKPVGGGRELMSFYVVPEK